MMSDIEYHKLLSDNDKIYRLINETCKDASQTIYTLGQCNHSKSLTNCENNFAFFCCMCAFVIILIIFVSIVKDYLKND